MTAKEFVAEIVRLANNHEEPCREDCKIEACLMGHPQCEAICLALVDYGLVHEWYGKYAVIK